MPKPKKSKISQDSSNTNPSIPNPVLLRLARKKGPARRQINPQSSSSHNQGQITTKPSKPIIQRFIPKKLHSFIIHKCSKPMNGGITQELHLSLYRHICSSLDIPHGDPSESLEIEIFPISVSIPLSFSITHYKFVFSSKKTAYDHIFVLHDKFSTFLFVDCSKLIERSFLNWYTKVFDVISKRITFNSPILSQYLSILVSFQPLSAVQKSDIKLTYTLPNSITKLNSITVEIPNSEWIDSSTLIPRDFQKSIVEHLVSTFRFSSPQHLSITKIHIGGLFIHESGLSLSNWSTPDIFTAISILLPFI